MVGRKVKPYLQMNYINANITQAPSMNMIIIPILSNTKESYKLDADVA